MTPSNQDSFTTFLVEFGRFREENQREHGELRDDQGRLRAEMHREFNSQLRWMIGTIGGMGVAVVVAIATSAIHIAGRLP